MKPTIYVLDDDVCFTDAVSKLEVTWPKGAIVQILSTDPRKSETQDSCFTEEAWEFKRPPRCAECGFPTHALNCPRRKEE